ncbi:MAG: inorganic phosphate transporter [Chlamydiales bacterium]|nr:inorganic phosphate transporter [Chlamydiales bacterium]
MTTLLIIAILVGFYVAWNIGANDVANAVGPSVGSGALSLVQAVIIAAIFEFCGAFLLGSNVSETLESGIVDPTLFALNNHDYILGMLGALIGTGVWLQVASYFGWPVSTTHTIVGGVLGFGLVYGGFTSIYWDTIWSIAASWVISPLMGGALGYLFFSIIRKRILYHSSPFRAMLRATPYFAFSIFFLITLIMLFGGLRGLDFHLNTIAVLIVAICIGIIAALFAKLLLKKELKQESSYDKVEKIFSYLLIVIACFMAFAHGSNDVANVIGPLSAIVNGLQGRPLFGQSVPLWLLLLGGGGIVVGLATWGWRVIETVGKKITSLTPSRGFAAGFAAALTIMLASKLGLPISTTHVLVGAVLGVGFARGIGAINLGTLRDIALSWVITVPAGAGSSIVFFYILKSIF